MGRKKAKGNSASNAGSRGSSAGEDSKENENCAFDSYMDYLINVANEEAGAMCDSHAASKNYNNVASMVMQMYKTLLSTDGISSLLPGAVISPGKIVSPKQLHMVDPVMPDPDRGSPFIGILRSCIAIFLIPPIN